MYNIDYNYGHKLSMYIVDYIVYKSFSVDTKLGYQQKEIVSSVCVLGCIYTRTAWCSLYSYDWFIKKKYSVDLPMQLGAICV